MSLAISSAAVARLAACACGTCAACAPRPVMQAVSAPVAEPASRANEDRYEPSGRAPTIADDSTQISNTGTATSTATSRAATFATPDGSTPPESTTQRQREATPTDEANAQDPAAESSTASGPQQLSDDERRMIAELQARDREVRSHEAAHQAAGGGYVGGASYSYQQGPDGRQYAIGGEVPVDMSTGGGSPEAVIAKMAQVRAAAMAPADPSAQDFAVAAAAAAIAAAARQEQRAAQETEATTETAAATSEAQVSTVTGADRSQPAERRQADDSGGKDRRRDSAKSLSPLLGDTAERGDSPTANGPAIRSEGEARPAGRAVNAYRAAEADAGRVSQIDQRA